MYVLGASFKYLQSFEVFISLKLHETHAQLTMQFYPKQIKGGQLQDVTGYTCPINNL